MYCGFNCLWHQFNMWVTQNSILYKVKKEKKKQEKLLGIGANVLGWKENRKEHALICL